MIGAHECCPAGGMYVESYDTGEGTSIKSRVSMEGKAKK